MTRIKDTNGVMHFVNPAHAGHTLCCRTSGTDLLGQYSPLGKETYDPVTCPDCAKVVCACRNEPYNTLVAEVDDATLDKGIFAAVEPDGPVGDKGSAASAPSDAERPSLTGGNLEDRDPLR